MPIEPSPALDQLEVFFRSLEKKLIDFPVLDKPVYAKPISCEKMDTLNKYSGYQYNVRLVQASLVYEDGTPVFLETDVFRMLRGDPGVIARAATEISSYIFTSFDTLKN